VVPPAVPPAVQPAVQHTDAAAPLATTTTAAPAAAAPQQTETLTIGMLLMMAVVLLIGCAIGFVVSFIFGGMKKRKGTSDDNASFLHSPRSNADDADVRRGATRPASWGARIGRDGMHSLYEAEQVAATVARAETRFARATHLRQHKDRGDRHQEPFRKSQSFRSTEPDRKNHSDSEGNDSVRPEESPER
jgi:hypothetical protein